MNNYVLLAIAAIAAILLLNRRVRENTPWRATVTPLASIIGSGFLVIAPLLGHAVNGLAPFAMLGIVMLAYAIGSAIRFNISRTEPLLHSGATPTLRRLESASSLLLACAYFISVAFYLRLLASFLLRGISWNAPMAPEILATALLLTIGISGWFGGLHALEHLEEYSVSIKLAVIASLLVGWAIYDVTAVSTTAFAVPINFDGWHTLRVLAGILIVVQGFETSRYLGEEYDAQMRVRTMRYAQISSGLIYVVFVALLLPALDQLPQQADETAVIDLSRPVAAILPTMLIVAAVMSQFSAAIADTVGAGGLVQESTPDTAPSFLGGIKLNSKVGYTMVAVLGIILVWTADVFQIISVASRAFALYYALQCAIATWTARKLPAGWSRTLHLAGFSGLTVLLAAVTVFALPAD